MAKDGEAEAEAEFELDLDFGRRHVIKRPRLTRLLDDTKSRIVMLVAPAGYGKTTLAREWLEDKPHAWYQVTAASTDVAALAAGIADALQPFEPGGRGSLGARLRSADAPGATVELLARTLAEHPERWPPSTCLVVDDYHLLTGSGPAEELVAAVSKLSPIRLLVTTRHRPPWATARRILYGEIFELGRDLLAMSGEEGRALLRRIDEHEAAGLLSVAEGWPAVLGLAATAGKGGRLEKDLPATLYDFLAEEVYGTAFAALGDALHQLAMIPRLTVSALKSVFRARAPALLEECVRLGLLTPLRGGEIHLHPLLRQFLRQKGDPHRTPVAVFERLSNHYRRERAWDDALAAAASSGRPELLVETLEAAYGDLVSEGRVQTLGRWINQARQSDVTAPIVDLASAELAFRQGHVRKALALAEHSATRFPPGHASAPRAFRLAAHAAARCDLFERAFELFTTSREVASTTDDLWEATWGLFIGTVSLERDTAERLLADLLKFDADSPELALRQAVAPYLYGTRFGSLAGTLAPLRHAEHLLDRSGDPLVRSAFLNAYADRLVLGASYERAEAVAERQIQEIQRWGLHFALAVGLSTRAAAEFGRRNFTLALSSLDSADAVAATLSEGSHTTMSSLALRARVMLARGRPQDAVGLLDRNWEHLPEPSMVGEYLATRALALVCSGDRRAGEELAGEALALTHGVEARVLAEAVHAISALSTRKQAGAVARFVEVVAETGNADGFVAAYRSHPPLLAAATQTTFPGELRQLVDHYDRDLARRVGLAIDSASPESKLSKREREVFALLRRGLTNREIARTLFISESTAKVHVRHILEKLGARSRTEAVAMGLLADVD